MDSRINKMFIIVQTILPCMTLHEYIVIKDLTAVQIPLKDNSVEALCIHNDYVIERYTRGTFGENIDYHYKIYQNNEIQTCIKVGDWKVEKLQSNSAWKPSVIYFDLIDPKGVSSADKKLPYYWINSENNTSIHVKWVTVSGINNLLQLAKEASSHTYWLSFIKARFEANATAKHNARILKLEEEVNTLQTKLSSIKSILEK